MPHTKLRKKRKPETVVAITSTVSAADVSIASSNVVSIQGVLPSVSKRAKLKEKTLSSLPTRISVAASTNEAEEKVVHKLVIRHLIENRTISKDEITDFVQKHHVSEQFFLKQYYDLQNDLKSLPNEAKICGENLARQHIFEHGRLFVKSREKDAGEFKAVRDDPRLGRFFDNHFYPAYQKAGKQEKELLIVKGTQAKLEAKRHATNLAENGLEEYKFEILENEKALQIGELNKFHQELGPYIFYNDFYPEFKKAYHDKKIALETAAKLKAETDGKKFALQYMALPPLPKFKKPDSRHVYATNIKIVFNLEKVRLTNNAISEGIALAEQHFKQNEFFNRNVKLAWDKFSVYFSVFFSSYQKTLKSKVVAEAKLQAEKDVVESDLQPSIATKKSSYGAYGGDFSLEYQKTFNAKLIQIKQDIAIVKEHGIFLARNSIGEEYPLKDPQEPSDDKLKALYQKYKTYGFYKVIYPEFSAALTAYKAVKFEEAKIMVCKDLKQLEDLAYQNKTLPNPLSKEKYLLAHEGAYFHSVYCQQMIDGFNKVKADIDHIKNMAAEYAKTYIRKYKELNSDIRADFFKLNLAYDITYYEQYFKPLYEQISVAELKVIEDNIKKQAEIQATLYFYDNKSLPAKDFFTVLSQQNKYNAKEFEVFYVHMKEFFEQCVADMQKEAIAWGNKFSGMDFVACTDKKYEKRLAEFNAQAKTVYEIACQNLKSRAVQRGETDAMSQNAIAKTDLDAQAEFKKYSADYFSTFNLIKNKIENAKLLGQGRAITLITENKINCDLKLEPQVQAELTGIEEKFRAVYLNAIVEIFQKFEQSTLAANDYVDSLLSHHHQSLPDKNDKIFSPAPEHPISSELYFSICQQIFAKKYNLKYGILDEDLPVLTMPGDCQFEPLSQAALMRVRGFFAPTTSGAKDMPATTIIISPCLTHIAAGSAAGESPVKFQL